MNYEKKRKRQNGRQKRNCEPQYKIWIDEYAQIHATIDKAIKDGILPPVDFDPTTLRTSFGGLQGAPLTRPGFPNRQEAIVI